MCFIFHVVTLKQAKKKEKRAQFRSNLSSEEDSDSDSGHIPQTAPRQSLFFKNSDKKNKNQQEKNISKKTNETLTSFPIVQIPVYDSVADRNVTHHDTVLLEKVLKMQIELLESQNRLAHSIEKCFSEIATDLKVIRTKLKFKNKGEEKVTPVEELPIKSKNEFVAFNIALNEADFKEKMVNICNYFGFYHDLNFFFL